jgi:hypothetical protein
VRSAGVKLQDRAFGMETHPSDPELKANLERDGDSLVEQAGELFDQISEMTPTTLAGAIAIIVLSGNEDEPLIANALAGLREIAEREARP